MTEADKLALLDAFAQAWNRHDTDALVSMMTPDGVFETAAGAEAFGTRHAGREALRTSFSAVFAAFPDARWEDATHVVAGERAFSEWTFRGTSAGGERVEVRGVDLFTLRDGRIARKDTFRKARVR
jgi:steroid delta-isomerase-like uncharacterized protein